MGEPVVYLNGELVRAGEARISVFDTGFLHAASVFTTLLGHHGRPFRLDRHLARLREQAEKIGLGHPATDDELADAVGQVLQANAMAEARIRITLTPGAVGSGEPTTLVTAVAAQNDPRWYSRGLGVIVSGVRQYEGDPTAGVKTGCYLTRVMARQAAAVAGADEALWFTVSGRLAEACYCNVFCVREGRVATPPLDTPVLPGVVRQAVIELCERLDLPTGDDEPITGEDLLAAEEVFLTSSVAGVRPVVRIDRRGVGDEKPGPITKRIMAAYADLLDAECPPPTE